MKGRKGLRLGLIVVAAMAGAGLLASTAFAQDPTVRIGSGSGDAGDRVTVTLEALDIGDPGLGAWSIDVSYDPDVVTARSCGPEHGAVCNPEFADDTVRLAGATAEGFEGDTVLGTLTFECGDDGGSSPLEISLADFADATVGGPMPIDASVENGSITCAGAAGEGIVIVDAGSGGMQYGGGFAWLIGLLSAVGLAVVAFGAVRVRRSRV
jgi:hypothetical protein